MSRRIGLLAVALVIALLGTFAVFSYVNKVEADTIAGTEPVDVLVAADRLVGGTTGAAVAQSQLAQLVAMPRKSVPEGALTSLDAVAAQSLVSDVFAGEVLLQAKFADQSARTGSLLIPKDKIAMSVELSDPQRVAGFVVPGSEVAIFVTASKAAVTPDEATEGAVTAAEDVDETVTRLLLPRTSVIAVGPSTLKPVEAGAEAAPAEAIARAVLTVAVTQQDAERLINARGSGELYMGLLSTTSKTAPTEGVTTTNLFQ